jgi:hypothetical protein
MVFEHFEGEIVVVESNGGIQNIESNDGPKAHDRKAPQISKENLCAKFDEILNNQSTGYSQ